MKKCVQHTAWGAGSLVDLPVTFAHQLPRVVKIFKRGFLQGIPPGSRSLLPPVAECTKTTGLKMYQGQFWANFRRGDAEKGSAPAVDVRPLLAGRGSAPHRPPEYKASC